MRGSASRSALSAPVATSRAVSGVRRWLSATTRTTGVGRKPGMRQVRSGSSASTVPTPTMHRSCRPRRAWPCRRAASPVIQRLSPRAGGDPAVQRGGELQRHQRPAVAARDWRSRRPTSSASLAARPRSPRCRRHAAGRSPAPFTRGSGSRVRDRPRGRRRPRSAHRCRAACWPQWQQGSSVT